MEGFGITQMKKINYVQDNIALIPENWKQLKRQVSGWYGSKDQNGQDGFNNKVLKNYLSQFTGNWNQTYNSTKFFPSFEMFFNKITKGRSTIIEEVVEKILRENADYPGITKFKVHAAFIVRMANTYYGTNAEDRVINTLNHLESYITCIKTDDETDMVYKVDAVIEVAPIEKFAIQIKPVSNKLYDTHGELPFHDEYTQKTGNKVFYFYYDEDKLVIQDQEVKLSDSRSIVEILTNIVYSL
jgi:hypothetical protein